MFVNAVARGWGVSNSEVRKGFGEGDTMVTNEPTKLGMADLIGSLDATIGRLTRKRRAVEGRAEMATTIRFTDNLGERI